MKMKKFIAITVVFTMLLFITACTAQSANLLDDEDFTVYVSNEMSINKIESDTSSEDESVVESEVKKSAFSQAEKSTDSSFVSVSSVPKASAISEKNSTASKSSKSEEKPQVQKRDPNNFKKTNSPRKSPDSYTTAEFLKMFGLKESDIKPDFVKPGELETNYYDERVITDFALSITGGNIKYTAKNLKYEQVLEWLDKILAATRSVSSDNVVFRYYEDGFIGGTRIDKSKYDVDFSHYHKGGKQYDSVKNIFNKNGELRWNWEYSSLYKFWDNERSGDSIMYEEIFMRFAHYKDGIYYIGFSFD